MASIISRARAAERPEVLMLVAGDEVALRIVAAWATPGAVTSRILDERWDGTDPASALKWLWRRTAVDIHAVAVASATTEAQVRRRLPLLKANQIVYPDGTVHALIHRLLQERVLRQFGQGEPRRKRERK